MREEFKKHLKPSSFLRIGIVLITYIFLLYHLNEIFLGVNKLSSLLTPFIFGFIIAYFDNV